MSHLSNTAHKILDQMNDRDVVKVKEAAERLLEGLDKETLEQHSKIWILQGAMETIRSALRHHRREQNSEIPDQLALLGDYIDKRVAQKVNGTDMNWLWGGDIPMAKIIARARAEKDRIVARLDEETGKEEVIELLLPFVEDDPTITFGEAVRKFAEKNKT